MKRVKEEFLEKLEEVCSLEGKNILEVGCGMGTRSIQIAKRGKFVTAIDPSRESIKIAKKNNILENIEYQIGRAETLRYKSKSFDVAIFTLSLHHVPLEKMRTAIKEAVRVVRKNGYIVFLEPGHSGSFFESEILFDACDGDERKQKAFAYYSILQYKNYKEITEIPDETIFQFESYEDFVQSMNPKKNKKMIQGFLEKNNYILKASRRINIFQVK